MQLEFFPSPSLTRYLAKLFIVRILAVLIMLVLVLQTLDLLSESGKIMGVAGNGEAQLWHYVSLRIPQLIARFLPYSVLLATIITLATLNQNSEVVAMKAAGLSAHQVLAPLLLTAAAISVVSFAFNEAVVTRTTGTLKAWQAVEYKQIPADAKVRANVYLPDGPHILAAGQVSGSGKLTRMDNVTWYRRDAGGMVLEQIRSPSARYAGPGWLLSDPVRFDVAATAQTKLPSMVVAQAVTPTQVVLAKVDPDRESLFQLRRSIDTLVGMRILIG